MPLYVDPNNVDVEWGIEFRSGVLEIFCGAVYALIESDLPVPLD